MQLGISSYTYGWSVDHENSAASDTMDEYDLIEKAKQFGIKLLQIGDNLPLHEWDEERLKAFEKGLKENAITLEIGAKGLTADHLYRYIHLCKRFDTRILRFIIDDKEYEPSFHEIISIIESNITALEQNNITLTLENHDRFTATEYAEIIKQADSKQVGICLDTVNSMGAGEGIAYIIETLAPYTVNLHLKDFGIARLPHKQGFIVDGRIAGEGMLNIPSLIEELLQYNRRNNTITTRSVLLYRAHLSLPARR